MIRPRTRLLALLAFVLTLGTVAAAGAVADTEAAWTDRVHVSAVATAGTWSTPTTNTCVAYSAQNTVMPGCVVTGIDSDGWGNPGDQTRNYYVKFSGTNGAKYVTFNVVLPSTVGGVTWTWTNAGVASGPQFTASGGWTCGQLPRVLGRSIDWQVGTVWFQVHQNRTGKTVYCP